MYLLKFAPSRRYIIPHLPVEPLTAPLPEAVASILVNLDAQLVKGAHGQADAARAKCVICNICHMGIVHVKAESLAITDHA
jgi:hypothetical protein